MRKSTLFISAALTAFTLAILVGVVSAYQNIAGTSTTDQAAAPQVVEQQAPVVDLPTQAPLPTAIPNITPEQAASIASTTIGRTDMYSVELVQFEGADAYLVTFSSGDLVYVNMQGQVVSISKIVVTVVKKPRNGGGGGEGGGGGGGGQRSSGGGEDGGGEHEGGND